MKDEIIAHLLKLLSDKQAELSDKQAEYKTALWLRKTRRIEPRTPFIQLLTIN